MKTKKIAVIMAGGLGVRLWPRSTEKKPKQFIHLLGEGTMIQNTVSRLLPLFYPEDIYIVASRDFSELLSEQLPMIPQQNLIFEPYGKNTAPCIALALTCLQDKCDDSTIVSVFPSDHEIYNIREFQHSLEIAIKTAHIRKGIATIGITPTRPETGFGYIQIKDEPGDLKELYDEGVRFTRTFAEKPDGDTAERFVESGDFLWNSGIFVWRTDTFWQAFEKYLPEHDSMFKLLKKTAGKEVFPEAVEEVYRQIQSISVDYGILEKAENVFVVESSFSWSDLGTWDELYRLSMKDARNNVIAGDVISINTTNCMVNSSNKLIGIIGVEDLIVIDSEESILICRRGHSAETKELIDFMRRKQINHYL